MQIDLALTLQIIVEVHLCYLGKAKVHLQVSLLALPPCKHHLQFWTHEMYPLELHELFHLLQVYVCITRTLDHLQQTIGTNGKQNIKNQLEVGCSICVTNYILFIEHNLIQQTMVCVLNSLCDGARVSTLVPSNVIVGPTQDLSFGGSVIIGFLGLLLCHPHRPNTHNFKQCSCLKAKFVFAYVSKTI